MKIINYEINFTGLIFLKIIKLVLNLNYLLQVFRDEDGISYFVRMNKGLIKLLLTINI